jgi:cell division transport system ATP-binding protein
MGVFGHLFGRLPAAVAASAIEPAPASRGRARPVIHLDRVVLSYPGVRALDRVGFSLRAGELAFLIGPTGAGKTSVLSLLEGSLKPTSGEVWVAGIAMHKARPGRARRLRRQIGIVPQEDLLVPKRTVQENVALALELADLGLSRAEAVRRADGELAVLKLGRRATAFPAQLSAGERRRVAVAQALVRKPGLIFADEPTGHLDAARTRDVVEALAAAARGGATVLVTAHSADLAKGLRARLLHLRAGRLVNDEEQRARRLWVIG